MTDESGYLRPRITLYQGELIRDGITKVLQEGLDHVLEPREVQALEDLRIRFTELIILAEARQTIRDLKSTD